VLPTDNGERHAVIQTHGPGYWLWLAGASVMVISNGVEILSLRFKAEKCGIILGDSPPVPYTTRNYMGDRRPLPPTECIISCAQWGIATKLAAAEERQRCHPFPYRLTL
jgi:hypothetical protein